MPLGDAYLELIAIVDEVEAAQSPFGSWIAPVSPATARLLGWAVRTDDLDAECRRLGLAMTPGSRATGDGQLLRWRAAGVERAMDEPCLPFFIEWERGTALPGEAPVTHRDADLRISELHLDGDADRLTAWLGDHDLPITIRPGTPAVAAVTLTGASGETVLDAEGLEA